MYHHYKVEEEEEDDDDVFVDKKVSPIEVPDIEQVNSSVGEKKEERVKKSLLSRFSFGGRKGGKKVTSTKDLLASVGMEMALLVGIISNEERNLSDIVEESESTANVEVNNQPNPIERKDSVPYHEMSLINRRRLSRRI